MYNLFGHLVNEYYVRKFRGNMETRRKKLAQIHTPGEFAAYQIAIRQKIKDAFRLPDTKCPLEAVVTGTLQRPGFHVENIIYHSRPHLSVTANLYVPDNAKNAPAVLFLCGHSDNGKACDTYQTAILDLVHDGYVVLCPDPSGQGERSLFEQAPYAEETEVVPGTVSQHNMLSKQMLLVGEYYTSWCLWDAVRSLDYLLTRPEINQAQVCVTGNSGGGNMSAFLTAIDERLFAAAPSCYISTWEHHIENEEACDAEQEPQFLVGYGCEMGDLLLAYAPRPILILSQKNDFFDARGAKDTYEEIKPIYELLGASANVRLFTGPGHHGYSRENREAMNQFFNQMLGRPAPDPEPENVPIFSDAELQCTPKGQVFYLPGEKRFLDLTCEIADQLAASRPKLSHEALADKLAALCNIQNRDTVPHYRMLRPCKVNLNYPQFCSRMALETEENMLAILKYVTPSTFYSFHCPEDFPEANLYVPHLDSGDEMLRLKLNRQEPGCFGIDYRGIGETMSLACYTNSGNSRLYGQKCSIDPLYSQSDAIGRDLFAYYCDDYHYSACGLMLGDLYIAGRVRDILAAFNFLHSKGMQKINLIAKGQGCVPAAIAAVIAKHNGTTTFYDAPASFDAMLRSQVIPYPQSMMPAGILTFTDLPELYNLLNASLHKTLFP